jgi:hypothetical protein
MVSDSRALADVFFREVVMPSVEPTGLNMRVELPIFQLSDQPVGSNDAYIKGQLAAKLGVEPLMIDGWTRVDHAGMGGAVFEVVLKGNHSGWDRAREVMQNATDSIRNLGDAMAGIHRQRIDEAGREYAEQLAARRREQEAALERIVREQIERSERRGANRAAVALAYHYQSNYVHSGEPFAISSIQYVNTPPPTPTAQQQESQSTVTLVTKTKRAVAL